MDPITTAIVAVAAFAYMVYRQFIQRPVTTRDIVIPIVGGLYLADRYLSGGSMSSVALVLGGAASGLFTGLLSGMVVRVWFDSNSSAVYQRGGWSYLGVLAGLIVVRIVLHGLLSLTGAVDANAINAAFLAMAAGNYVSRAITVGLRALALVGWDFEALPKRAVSTTRRQRSW